MFVSTDHRFEKRCHVVGLDDCSIVMYRQCALAICGLGSDSDGPVRSSVSHRVGHKIAQSLGQAVTVTGAGTWAILNVYEPSFGKCQRQLRKSIRNRGMDVDTFANCEKSSTSTHLAEIKEIFDQPLRTMRGVSHA